MRKLWYSLLVFLALTSCEEEVSEAEFRIDIQGFSLDEVFVGSDGEPSSFSHKFSGGNITFSGDQGSL